MLRAPCSQRKVNAEWLESLDIVCFPIQRQKQSMIVIHPYVLRHSIRSMYFVFRKRKSRVKSKFGIMLKYDYKAAPSYDGVCSVDPPRDRE
jgi:hypothetical protein